MEASKHHDLSKVPEELLRDALRQVDSIYDSNVATLDKYRPDLVDRGYKPRSKLNLDALYLGNWLRDVSQVVVPDTYAAVGTNYGKKPLAEIETYINQIIDTIPAWVSAAVKWKTGRDPVEMVRTELRKQSQTIQDAIDTLAVVGTTSAFADAMRDLFWGVGYFKFVAEGKSDAKAKGESKMSVEAYTHIFEKWFTQYHAHEHLDRPAIGEGDFETELSKGPLSERLATYDENRDLYDYLRQHIKLAAGLLAYLDGGTQKDDDSQRSWAAATFNPFMKTFVYWDENKKEAEAEVSDQDPVWLEHLAMLGYAFHQIEDFYGHSIFVELASDLLSPTYRMAQREEHAHILQRRLSKWCKDWRGKQTKGEPLDPELNVVTGYFETTDTILSIMHILEDIIGVVSERPEDTISKDIDDVLQFEYKRTFNDLMDLITNPGDVYRHPKGNSVAEWLEENAKEQWKKVETAEEGDETFNKIVDTIEGMPIFEAQDSELFKRFKNAVLFLGRAKGTYGLVRNTYDAITTVRAIVSGPAAWLRAFLKDLVLDFIRDKTLDWAEVYLKEILFEAIGSQNIGSHSLIAKDCGPELFHDASMNCARAVDYYVISTLARYTTRADIEVCRSCPKKENYSVVAQTTFVDWLHLLEYFLCNPLAGLALVDKPVMMPGKVFHITRGDPENDEMSSDSLKSLAQEYAGTFAPRPGVEWSWELIADANYGTAGLPTKERKRRINDALERSGKGVSTADRFNMAFKPGVRVLIPHQNLQIYPHKWKDPNHVKDRWWYVAIHGGSSGHVDAQEHIKYRTYPMTHSASLDLIKEVWDMRIAYQDNDKNAAKKIKTEGDAAWEQHVATMEAAKAAAAARRDEAVKKIDAKVEEAKEAVERKLEEAREAYRDQKDRIKREIKEAEEELERIRRRAQKEIETITYETKERCAKAYDEVADSLVEEYEAIRKFISDL